MSEDAINDATESQEVDEIENEDGMGDEVTDVEATDGTNNTDEAGEVGTADGETDAFDRDRAMSTIRKLRGEIKNERTRARDGDKRAKAAEERNSQILETIAKSLGLTGEDEQPDPEKLMREIEEERGRTLQARLEAAVFRAASSADVDAEEILDSNAFRRSVRDLDPLSDSFGEDIVEALTDFVEQRPRFKRTKATATQTTTKTQAKPKAKVSGGDIRGGAGAEPITEAQLAAMYKAGKHNEISKLLEEGRLSHLL